MLRMLAARAASFAAALALALPAAAGATSVTASPPHDPGLGCKAIAAVIDDLKAGRLKEAEALIGPTFFADAFGEVEEAEEQAFLHALHHNEGRPDARPMRLDGVFRVHADRHQPVYLVALEREAWHETRLETDGMLVDREVRDPHYARDISYWLATFRSNDIWYFREAGELYPLADDERELKGCAP